jgi:hypothetical protein
MSKLYLLHALRSYHDWIALQPYRWRRHIPAKDQLTFNGLHGDINPEVRTLQNIHRENLKSYRIEQAVKLREE